MKAAAMFVQSIADALCALISAACIYYVTGVVGFQSHDIRMAVVVLGSLMTMERMAMQRAAK